MPYDSPHQTMYVGSSGKIATLNSATLYKPGELGQRIIAAGLEYQTVLSDSGPASIAAGDVAFWINRSTYTVTNKLADVPLGRNGVAGVFQTTVTPGNYCRIQTGGEYTTGVKSASTGAAQGMLIIANSGTNSDSAAIPAGTAPGYVVLGICDGVQAAGKTPIDITIGAMSVTP